MRKTIVAAAAMGLLGTAAFALPAMAGARCDNASLSGAYGYATSGTVTEGGATTGLAFAGTFNFDGAGNVTGSDVTNFGGQALPLETFTGTYKVKGNCTGNYSVQSTESGTLSGYFTIVSGGTEIEIVGTEDGAIYAGAARRR